MIVRPADAAEIAPLAEIWHAGWHDAHAAIVPAALTRVRTLASFADRLRAALATMRVAGPPDAPRGLCMTKDDELHQMYVAAPFRGAGVAAALMADGEARLAAAGVATAWLACAIGNARAARFYEKCGWSLTRTVVDPLETPDGFFPLEVWRYEKVLAR